jgi:hypothetical protein
MNVEGSRGWGQERRTICGMMPRISPLLGNPNGGFLGRIRTIGRREVGGRRGLGFRRGGAAGSVEP